MGYFYNKFLESSVITPDDDEVEDISDDIEDLFSPMDEAMIIIVESESTFNSIMKEVGIQDLIAYQNKTVFNEASDGNVITKIINWIKALFRRIADFFRKCFGKSKEKNVKTKENIEKINKSVEEIKKQEQENRGKPKEETPTFHPFSLEYIDVELFFKGIKFLTDKLENEFSETKSDPLKLLSFIPGIEETSDFADEIGEYFKQNFYKKISHQFNSVDDARIAAKALRDYNALSIEMQSELCKKHDKYSKEVERKISSLNAIINNSNVDDYDEKLKRTQEILSNLLSESSVENVSDSDNNKELIKKIKLQSNIYSDLNFVVMAYLSDIGFVLMTASTLIERGIRHAYFVEKQKQFS